MCIPAPGRSQSRVDSEHNGINPRCESLAAAEYPSANRFVCLLPVHGLQLAGVVISCAIYSRYVSSSMLACRVCKARAPRRRDVSPFASRDNELLCPVGSLLFGSRDVATEIRDTPSFFPSKLEEREEYSTASYTHAIQTSSSFSSMRLRLETDLPESRTRDTIRFSVLFFIARNWTARKRWDRERNSNSNWKFGNRVSSTLRFLGCSAR